MRGIILTRNSIVSTSDEDKKKDMPPFNFLSLLTENLVTGSQHPDSILFCVWLLLCLVLFRWDNRGAKFDATSTDCQFKEYRHSVGDHMVSLSQLVRSTETYAARIESSVDPHE